MPISSEKISLLVVDDDDAVRLVASEMLRSLGYDVTLAESGAQALQLLSQGSFAAVLVRLIPPK